MAYIVMAYRAGDAACGKDFEDEVLAVGGGASLKQETLHAPSATPFHPLRPHPFIPALNPITPYPNTHRGMIHGCPPSIAMVRPSACAGLALVRRSMSIGTSHSGASFQKRLRRTLLIDSHS